jgi:hypothetical protein
MIVKSSSARLAYAFAISALSAQFYRKKNHMISGTFHFIFVSVFEFGAKWLVPAMISGTFFLVISLPPMLTSAAVIIAKNTPKKDQAFVLSLRTTAERTTQVCALSNCFIICFEDDIFNVVYEYGLDDDKLSFWISDARRIAALFRQMSEYFFNN